METNKETYHWYKSRGICVMCQRNSAVPGETRCASCKEKLHERYKERYRFRQVGIYHELKNAGICPRCKVVKPEPGFTYCKECREKRRRRVKKTDD